MARCILLVQSNAVEGREDEFNEWYTQRHLADVLSVAGFVSAQRFVVSTTQPRPDVSVPFRYLAVYEIDGSPQSAIEAFRQAGGGMAMSDAMAEARMSVLYEPLPERFGPSSSQR